MTLIVIFDGSGMRPGKSSTVIPNGGPSTSGKTLSRARRFSCKDPREPFAASEEEGCFLAAERDDGDDWDAVFEGELHEPGSAGEADLAGLPGRAEAVLITAGVDEQRGVIVERASHVLRGGGHGPVPLHQRAQAGGLEDEVVRQLVEAALRPEVVIERLGEHERVGDHRAAGVVADKQHRAAWGIRSRPETSARK